MPRLTVIVQNAEIIPLNAVCILNTYYDAEAWHVRATGRQLNFF